MTKIDDMREEFEAAYTSDAPWNDEYSERAYIVWRRAWQAAKASQQPDVEALVAEVESLQDKVYYVDGRPHFSPSGDCVNEKINQIIGIIRKWAKGEV